MKNSLRTLALLIASCFPFSYVLATNSVPTELASFEVADSKLPAQKFILKTTSAIQAAATQFKTNKVATGDLANAYAHQRYAVSLFNSGLHVRAVYHSRLARQFAIKSLKANKASNAQSFSVDSSESGIFNVKSGMVSEGELMNDLKKQNGENTLSDIQVSSMSFSDISADSIR